MTDDVMQSAVATWATRGLPARIDVAATAKLLGFAESDIQVLMGVGKLAPLGDPAPERAEMVCRRRDYPARGGSRLAAQGHEGAY